MSTPRPTPIKTIAEGRRDVFNLRHQHIEPVEGFNARLDFDTPDDRALYEYLKHGGQVPPLEGRMVGDKFLLTDGERRWRQIGRLNADLGEKDAEGNFQPWALIPCLSEKRGTTPVERLARMLSANRGRQFSMIEQANVYARIQQEDPSLTTEQIATRCGVTRTQVEDCLLLETSAHRDLQSAVRTSRIAATLAVKLIRHTKDRDTHEPDLERQAELLHMADRNATAAKADHITRKHFGEHLEPRKKQPLADPIEETGESSGNGETKPGIQPGDRIVTDSTEAEAILLVRERGEASVSLLQREMKLGYARAVALIAFMVDHEILKENGDGTFTILPWDNDGPTGTTTSEGDDESEEESEDEDRTCSDCGALLGDEDLDAGHAKCWRCRPTKDVRPDDSGSGESSGKSVDHSKDSRHQSGAGRGEREAQSSGGLRDSAPYEPPTTIDIPLLEGFVSETSTTSSNDRRQAMAYLKLLLQGEINRTQLIGWIKTGNIDL